MLWAVTTPVITPPASPLAFWSGPRTVPKAVCQYCETPPALGQGDIPGGQGSSSAPVRLTPRNVLARGGSVTPITKAEVTGPPGPIISAGAFDVRGGWLAPTG